MNYITYQIAGTFPIDQELITQIPYNIKYINKIGIQLEPTESIVLNNNKIMIGNTGKLEIEDTQITSIKLHSINKSKLPVIIDMICCIE